MTENPSQVLEATESFAAPYGGETIVVQAGNTRVSADHDLAKRFPQHFRPVEDGLSFRTEEATANPGEHRARPIVEKTGRGKTAGSQTREET